MFASRTAVGRAAAGICSVMVAFGILAVPGVGAARSGGRPAGRGALRARTGRRLVADAHVSAAGRGRGGHGGAIRVLAQSDAPGRLIYQFSQGIGQDTCEPPIPGGTALFGESYSSSAFQQLVSCQSTGMTVSAPVGNPFDYGDFAGFDAQAPPGIAIGEVDASFVGEGGSSNWIASTYVNGVQSQSILLSGIEDTSTDENVGGNWGFALTCAAPGGCAGYDASLNAGQITMTATETTAPQVGVGGNLATQPAGAWLWNPAGDPWTDTTSATDSSGICWLGASLGGRTLFVTSGGTSPPSDWMVCGNAGDTTSVDLNAYADGAQTLQTGALNGAQLSTITKRTIDVDNAPVSVDLSTPNDANPTVWVDYPVRVVADTTAGPSGVGGTDCQVGNAPITAYTGPITLTGTGALTVTCTGWNRAVDPQGAARTGTTAITVHVDQTPPSAQFQPQAPGDPEQFVADVSDGASGLAGGSIAYAPVGTTAWRTVPTSLTVPAGSASGRLVASIDDHGLSGNYVVRATTCDVAGNCTATDETVTMPLRTGVQSSLGFAQVRAPRRVIRRIVLVGYRLERRRVHGRPRRVKVGGHYRIVSVVVGRNRRCATKKIRTGPHRWRELAICRKVTQEVVRSRRIGHGKAITVYGLLDTPDGVAVGNAPVTIRTRPDRPGGIWSVLGTTTTNQYGSWSFALPAGPSRLIRASYAGSATALPASGTATVTVPARIVLRLSPRVLPWSHTLRISGRLAGGYVPTDGVALRMLAYYPGQRQPSTLFAFRTNRHGRFATSWSYHAGRGVDRIRFTVATTGSETDYPWARAHGRLLGVTFGEPTP